MAATEPIDIVELGVGDAQAGLVLSTEAGWNQNEADWRFFLSQGIVFGMRDGARLVATAALLPYSAGNAWISMVLVTADFRRRSIATSSSMPASTWRHRRGLTTWLDAHAGRCHRLRAARLHADAAIETVAATKPPGQPGRQGSFRRQPRRLGRARCQRHGIRPQHVAGGIFCAARARASCPTIEPWPSSAMDAPRAISVRCWPIAPGSGASAGGCHRQLRDAGHG